MINGTGIFPYIHHVGCTFNLYSIISNGLVLGCQNLSRRQTVFFLLVDPRNGSHRDPEYIDFSVPCRAKYVHSAWKHQDAVFWVDIKLSIKEGLSFYQTRSNAKNLQGTLPAHYISKVERLKTGEKLYERRYLSLRPPPKISLKHDHDWTRGNDQLGSTVEHQPVGKLVQQSLGKTLQVGSSKPTQFPKPIEDPSPTLSNNSWCRRQQRPVTDSRAWVFRTLPTVGSTFIRSPNSISTPSWTVSLPRIPRSCLHCDTCPMLILSISSLVRSTSVCCHNSHRNWASRRVSVLTMLLSWSNGSEVCLQLENQSVHFIGSRTNSSGLPINSCVDNSRQFLKSGRRCTLNLTRQVTSMLGESLPSSLVAEVAWSAAGWLLRSVPLASTWLLWYRCWHAVLPVVLNSWGYPRLIWALTATAGHLLRFLLTSLTPVSPGALRSTLGDLPIVFTKAQITFQCLDLQLIWNDALWSKYWRSRRDCWLQEEYNHPESGL